MENRPQNELSVALDKLDPNFLTPEMQRGDMRFHNARSAPFVLHGHEAAESDIAFCRMPRAIAATINEHTGTLNEHTAGIRLRFATDSPYIAIHATAPAIVVMGHMAQIGISGFDIYADGVFVGMTQINVMNPEQKNGINGMVDLKTRQMRQIEICFPLYNPVNDVFIGLAEDAALLPPRPYARPIPMLFYGSSITQGGCAERAGLCYQAHLSRWFDSDYRNLGFSGNAKGEPRMAEYIAAQKMSVFVMDYDHNAPSVEHLAKTHAPFFRTVREAQPLLPIILISRPAQGSPEEIARRRAVIRKTYEDAKAAGDENVYFIDGEAFFPEELRDSCTVDCCHPNSLGFFFMAMGIKAVLEQIFGKNAAKASLPPKTAFLPSPQNAPEHFGAKGILFDLDGTLLDTLEDLYLSVNAALAEFGMPRRTRDEVKYFVGSGAENLMKRAVPGGAQNPLFEVCFTAFRSHYSEHCKDHTLPYPGILDLLRSAREKGVKIGIVSNKYDSAVKKLAELYFPDLYDIAVGESDGVRKKPAPDSLLAAMEKLQLTKENTLYVGDSDIDILTGSNADVRTVGVLWGLRDRPCLESVGATEFAERPEELLRYLPTKTF